jgi:hypothetical protein
MEFEEKFIEENQLTKEQIDAVSSVVDTHVADLQKTWDGKANENAEAIIGGAGKKVIELTGIQREQGEKWADYLERSNGLYFEGTKNALKTKEEELEKKLKGSGGDELIKKELEDTKELLKGLKQKEAEYDELVKGEYKDKYEGSLTKLTAMERKVAFRDNLPPMPETINKYEWNAKIKEFQSAILEKNNLVFDENDTAYLVDKENEFKKVKLEDAIKQDQTIQDLIKGRDNKGMGSKPKNIQIDGVPFDLPENATPQDRTKAIREYLLNTEKISQTDSKYSARFAELNRKILGLEKNPEKK